MLTILVILFSKEQKDSKKKQRQKALKKKQRSENEQCFHYMKPSGRTFIFEQTPWKILFDSSEIGSWRIQVNDLADEPKEGDDIWIKKSKAKYVCLRIVNVDGRWRHHNKWSMTVEYSFVRDLTNAEILHLQERRISYLLTEIDDIKIRKSKENSINGDLNDNNSSRL